MSSPRIVDVTELILRDAHQSLMATRMATEDMVPACEDLDQAGFWSLECWGGATFDSCIRFLNEDPWERLRAFKAKMPKTPLQMLLRGQNLVGYRHYEDGVVDRFVQKAADNGIDVFRVFDALNDIRNVEASAAAIKECGGHFEGAISYTVSPVHTLDSFVEYALQLKELGADKLVIVMENCKPILGDKVRYYRDKVFTQRLQPAPALHCSAGTGKSPSAPKRRQCPAAR